MSDVPKKVGDVCMIVRGPRFLRSSLGVYIGLDEDEDYLVRRLMYRDVRNLTVSYYEPYEFSRELIKVVKKVRV